MLHLLQVQTSKIEVPRDVRNSKSGNMTSSGKIVSTLEKMQVPNGTGPGVRSIKLLCWLAAPLVIVYGHVHLPKLRNKVKVGNKVQFGNKVTTSCNVCN